MNGNLGFVLATNGSLDDIREVLANNRRKSRTNSNVDLGLPSGPTGMDSSHTSFFQLLSIGTKRVDPGASELVLDLATVALMDGASVFIFSVILQEVDTFHFAFDTDAFMLSATSGVALVSPAIFNVVARDSEEQTEDLLFPNIGSTSDFPSDIAFYFTERIVASADGRKMVRITAGGVEVAIPSGQSDRVHVLALGSSVSVDPPTDLTFGSEVSVFVDAGVFLDMAGRASGLRFRPLPTQMCVLVYTDSALHSPDADPDEEGSDDEWLAKAKTGIRVRFQHDVLVFVVVQGDLKKTIWSLCAAEASACRNAFDLAECTRAIWYQVVIGGDKWKEEHDYRLQELVRLPGQRCKRT